MLDAGVATRRGVMCAHREEAYPRSTWRCGAEPRTCTTGTCSHLRESEKAQDHCIILPLYSSMTAQQQVQVVGALRNALGTPA